MCGYEVNIKYVKLDLVQKLNTLLDRLIEVSRSPSKENLDIWEKELLEFLQFLFKQIESYSPGTIRAEMSLEEKWQAWKKFAAEEDFLREAFVLDHLIKRALAMKKFSTLEALKILVKE